MGKKWRGHIGEKY